MDGSIINFKYKFTDDYNPVYINGAFGGPGPGGEIVANFYLERTPIPNNEKVLFKEDDARVTQVEPKDHDVTVLRYVSTGIIMNLDTAKAVHEWLGNHIKHMEKQQGE